MNENLTVLASARGAVREATALLVRMLLAPIPLAYMPVIKAARLGAHTPELENMRVNRTPSRVMRA